MSSSSSLPSSVTGIGSSTSVRAPILTAALADAGVATTAVEPVAAMRERFAERHLDLTCLDGSAEQFPFDDETVDAIVVGQAFHWFDHGPALDESPGSSGLMASSLIWNVRDQSIEWVRRWSDIVTDPHGTTPRHHDMAWRRAIESDLRFTPFEDHVVANPWPTTRQGVVDRAPRSATSVPWPSPSGRRSPTPWPSWWMGSTNPSTTPTEPSSTSSGVTPGAFRTAASSRGSVLGGHQSVVHRARWNDRDVALKCELEPDPWLDHRMRIAAAAADTNSQVIGPLAIDGVFVAPIGVGGAPCTPSSMAIIPDIADSAMAEQMGRTLARLHATLRTLDGTELPDIAALRICDLPDDPAPQASASSSTGTSAQQHSRNGRRAPHPRLRRARSRHARPRRREHAVHRTLLRSDRRSPRRCRPVRTGVRRRLRGRDRRRTRPRGTRHRTASPSARTPPLARRSRSGADRDRPVDACMARPSCDGTPRPIRRIGRRSTDPTGQIFHTAPFSAKARCARRKGEVRLPTRPTIGRRRAVVAGAVGVAARSQPTVVALGQVLSCARAPACRPPIAVPGNVTILDLAVEHGHQRNPLLHEHDWCAADRPSDDRVIRIRSGRHPVHPVLRSDPRE